MKIGIDIRLIGKKQTGSEVTFFNLVKNLALIDKRNEYCLFTDMRDKKEVQKVKEDLGITNNEEFEIVSLATKNKFIWNFWALPSQLRKNPVDIYLTQYITPFFVPEKIKVATIIHDISFKVHKKFIKKSDLFFLSLLIPHSLKRADKIIAVSQFTRDEIIKYYKIPAEKIDYIYNAVSDDFLAQDVSLEKIEAVRKKYDLPEKYILYIGTLQPRKNIPALIKAFSSLKKDRGNNILQYSRVLKDELRLVIAGGKMHNYDLKIDETIKECSLENKIIFPGFIDEEDKAALLKGAVLFCYPSYYEGFGIPILEAMSVGTPTVVSGISPHMEIAGDASIFFDPDNPRELAEKLVGVINNENLRQDLVQKGLGQATKFSWKKTAEKMTKIFESLS